MKTYSRHDRQGLHRHHKVARRALPKPYSNTFWFALIGIVLLASIVLLWSWVIATLVAEGVL